MLKLFYFRWNLVISDLAVEDRNSWYFCFRRTLKVFIRVFWALSYLYSILLILLVGAFLPFYRYSTLAPQSHEDLHQLWALSDCYFFFYHVSCFWRCCCCTTSAADLREFFLPSGLSTLHFFPTFGACTN